MNDILLLALSLIGLLALYWVFIGQSKWNNMLREKSGQSAKENEPEIKKQS